MARRNPEHGVGGAHLKICDLTSTIPNLGHYHLVIHAAAVHPTGSTEPTPASLTAGNVIATLNLCRALEKSPPTLVIFLSSISVYGAPAATLITEEIEPYSPNLYGMAKLAAEQILLTYKDTFPSLSLRLPGIYGPHNFGPWLGRLVHKARSGLPLEFSQPTNLFNHMIHLEDLFGLILHLTHTGPPPISIANLATSEPMLIQDIVEWVCTLTGTKSRILPGDTRSSLGPIGIRRVIEDLAYPPMTTRLAISRYLQGVGLPEGGEKGGS